MADKIRATLEKLLPDLINLQKREIFSNEEIKEIMRDRERNEYQLQRKNVRLKDFLKVIDYEYQLERRRLSKHNELSLKKQQNADFTVIKRIIQLWDKIMNKYRYNIMLWKQYLSFCYQIKSKKQFNKAVTQALRMNPYDLDLWLMAAYYEFDVLKNPFNARKIFYKALKVLLNQVLQNIPQQKQIWAQYLAFEVKVQNQIDNRQIFLGDSLKKTKEAEGFLSFKDKMQVEGEQVLEFGSTTDNMSLIKQISKLAFERFPGYQIKILFIESLESSLINANVQAYKEELLEQTITEVQAKLKVEQNDLVANDYFNLLLLKNNLEQCIQNFIDIIVSSTQIETILLTLISQIIKRVENILPQQLLDTIGTLFEILQKLDVNFLIHILDLFTLVEPDQIKQWLNQIIGLSSQFQPKNRITLLQKLLKLKCDPSQFTQLVDQDLKNINRGFWQISKEDLSTYLIAINQSDITLNETQIEEQFNLAKKNLISNSIMFQSYLDSLFGKYPPLQDKYVLQLTVLNRYCPLKYHVCSLNTIPQKSQWSQIQKIIQCFGQQIESWKVVFEWASKNSPSRLKELYEQGLREQSVDQIVLVELYNSVYHLE